MVLLEEGQIGNLLDQFLALGVKLAGLEGGEGDFAGIRKLQSFPDSNALARVMRFSASPRVRQPMR